MKKLKITKTGLAVAIPFFIFQINILAVQDTDSIKPPETLSTSENLPPGESKFGSMPSKPQAGQASFFGSGFSKRQVDDIDTYNEQGERAVLSGGSGAKWEQAQGEQRIGTRSPASSALISDPKISKGLNVSSEIKRKGVQEISVIASDLGFFPKRIFVNPEMPVRLFVTGASRNTLCMMMDAYDVRKQLRAGKIEEITFTPPKAGIYRFYCPINGMEGSVVVREAMRSEGPLSEPSESQEIRRNSLGDAVVFSKAGSDPLPEIVGERRPARAQPSEEVNLP